MTIILVAKDKILVIIDSCDYKPYNSFGQVAKDNQLWKIPHGMYNHPYSRISFATALIFHALTSGRTMWLQIWLYKILGNIFKN